MAHRTIKSADSAVTGDERRTPKTRAAIELLENWLADNSGYDETTWPRVARAIEKNRLSDRSRLSD